MSEKIAFVSIGTNTSGMYLFNLQTSLVCVVQEIPLWKDLKKKLTFPEDTQHRFDVRTTFFDRYGRWKDVKATSCAGWVAFFLLTHNEQMHKNKLFAF